MAKSKKQDISVEPTADKPAKKPIPKKSQTAEMAAPAPETASAPAAAEAKPAKGSRGKASAKAAPAAAASAPAELAKRSPEPASAARPAAATPATAPASKPASAIASSTPAKSPGLPSTAPRPSFGGIDTSLAARTAASLVANRDLLGGSSRPSPNSPTGGATKPQQKVESSSFKSLKQTLSQPGGGLNKILGAASEHKKGGLPFGGSGPAGTKGQSASGGGGNKLGVPRRTSG